MHRLPQRWPMASTSAQLAPLIEWFDFGPAGANAAGGGGGTGGHAAARNRGGIGGDGGGGVSGSGDGCGGGSGSGGADAGDSHIAGHIDTALRAWRVLLGYVCRRIFVVSWRRGIVAAG
jgi:hypothetical protein